MVFLFYIIYFIISSDLLLKVGSAVSRVVRQDDSTKKLFEGDIAGISPDMIDDLKKINKDPTVQFAAPVDNLFQQWPDGTVYYKIAETFTAEEKQVIQQAFDEYHQKTCIKFVPQTSEAAYIKVKKGLGCHSIIGRTGGEQDLSLGEGCVQKGIVIHEFMHALGFFHEQSRWDRDNYVSVKFENVQVKQRDQFLKHELGNLKNLGLPYDYGSIMHYGKDAFSKNGQPTIETIPDPNTEIGQRKGLSEIDAQNIRILYKCGGDATTKIAQEFLQQGVRLGNHYVQNHVDSVGECIKQCQSDDNCLAITHTSEKDSANNCFLYKDGYTSGYDPNLKFSTWTKNQIELGTRLVNHYGFAYIQDNAVGCKDICAKEDKCKAMSFDSATRYCYFFETYRMQVDDKMQWSSWRKRQ